MLSGHHHCQVPEYSVSSSLQRKPIPIKQSFLILPSAQPLAATDLFSFSADLPLLDNLNKWNCMTHGLLHVVFSVSIEHSGLIHGVAHSSTSFFSTANNIPFCGHTALCTPTYQSMNTWVVSAFGCCEHAAMYICVWADIDFRVNKSLDQNQMNNLQYCCPALCFFLSYIWIF